MLSFQAVFSSWLQSLLTSAPVQCLCVSVLVDFRPLTLFPLDSVSFYKPVGCTVDKDVKLQKGLVSSISFHLSQREQACWGAKSERGEMRRTNLWRFQKLGGTVLYMRTTAHRFLKWSLSIPSRLVGDSTWFHTLRVKVLAGQASQVCLFLQAIVLRFISLRQCRTEHLQAQRGVERYKQSPGNSQVPARTVKFWDNICSAVSSWQKKKRKAEREIQQSWGSVIIPTSQSCVVIWMCMNIWICMNMNHGQICICWRVKDYLIQNSNKALKLGYLLLPFCFLSSVAFASRW